jgi:two-component system sensor histidine kinase CpxA
MAERLQSLVNAQRALVSDVSHELRSPLTRLNLALELARQRAGGEASGALDRIDRESERLSTLIKQLLTLTRLESGSEEQGKEPVDLAQLVQDVGTDAEFEAHGRNRSVRVAVHAACETVGRADLLRSAIENIVRNAVRYTAEGTTVEISLECQSNGSCCRAVIRVRDHGPGVPETTLAHLFQPFYRVDDARDRQSGGTGLGLAIAQRAVEVYGGRIIVSNAPGGGLLVETYLPAVRKQNPTEAPH